MALYLYVKQLKRGRGDIVVKLVKYDIQGNEAGFTADISDTLLQQLHEKESLHSQSIKDYIVAIRNNSRQWSANTQRRSDMKCTGKKPHAQKGQGRSRQGDLVAPHYRGGAVVWGPQSRQKLDVWVGINRKEKKAAIRILLAEKILGTTVHVLQNTVMKEPKTQVVANFLEKVGMKDRHKDRRVLVIGSATEADTESRVNLVKSMRNIPKKDFMSLSQVNGYELVRAQQVIVLESAVEELIALLGNETKVG